MMAVEAVIFQQIVDANWDQAIYTASPNNTINVAQFAAKGSGTNIAVALTPKGTGYISAHVPDGTAAGGFTRGANSVDLQTSRTDQFHVANGSFAVVLGGSRNGANGENSIAGGRGSYAQFSRSIALGELSFSLVQDGVAIGRECICTGAASTATGSNSISHVRAMRSHGANALGVAGASQEIAIVLGGKTTSDAEVILTADSGASAVLRAGSAWSVLIHIIGSKSDGSAVARYHRQVTIKRVGSTTTLVGSAVSVGTDEAAGTTINITADDANDRLSVGVTGIAAETWRWVAVCHGVEMLIGA